MLIGLAVGLGEGTRNDGGIRGRHLGSRLHVMSHDDADLRLGEQLPKRLLRHKLLHKSSFLLAPPDMSSRAKAESRSRKISVPMPKATQIKAPAGRTSSKA